MYEMMTEHVFFWKSELVKVLKTQFCTFICCILYLPFFSCSSEKPFQFVWKQMVIIIGKIVLFTISQVFLWSNLKTKSTNFWLSKIVGLSPDLGRSVPSTTRIPNWTFQINFKTLVWGSKNKILFCSPDTKKKKKKMVSVKKIKFQTWVHSGEELWPSFFNRSNSCHIISTHCMSKLSTCIVDSKLG